MPIEARYARGLKIGGPADAAALLVRVLAPLEVEEFHVLLLDARHMVKRHEMLARGSLTGVEVHPREVFAPAIRYRAAAILCAHNHPSADATPSRQDLELTKRLVEIGELVGIPVVDHVIIGAGGRWKAFSELGLLKPAPTP
jgi:DNA repair protein RadC